MTSFLGQRVQFTRFAWLVLVFLLLVILWGAYVRATGSGAGCGSHWPLCNGTVIPRAARTETLIEYTHRITSAFSGVLIIVLVIWAFKLFPKGHGVRTAAALSMVFVITEGLVGAGLVLFEWVAHDASVGRAISIGLHLVNTFFLLAAVVLTAWLSGGDYDLRWRNQGRTAWLIATGFVLLIVLGASGAVTALGDTLFPAGSLAEGISQDFAPTAHFLIQLRIYHPILAVITGIYLVLAASALSTARPGNGMPLYARAVKVLVVTQLLAGAINILLNVPVWMQLIHLLLADLLWISFVLLAATALSQPARVPETATAALPGD